MIQIEKYLNKKQLLQIGDYYTNGEFLIKKDLCQKQQETPVENVKKTIDQLLDDFKYLNYTDSMELKGKLIISDLYLELDSILGDMPGVKVMIAHKYAPLKYMNGEELIGLIMPCQAPLTIEQQNMLMINNFVEYCNYKDLIPIQFKVLGEDSERGLFMPRRASDTFIKHAIRAHIKNAGGRWLGKFERRPDKLADYAKAAQELLEKTDKPAILKRMNDATKQEVK